MTIVGLDASGPGEFPGLKAFLAEDRTALRRLEGNCRLLAARRTIRNGFPPLASDRASRTAGPFAFARLAALGLVLEILIGEKLLFSRRPDELRAAVHALKDSVLELHRSLPRRGRSYIPRAKLLDFATELLAIAFSRQSLFRSAFVTGFQIEGMLLDVLDDVFLLDLPLEPAKGAFNRLALLDLDLGHLNHTPFGWHRYQIC